MAAKGEVYLMCSRETHEALKIDEVAWQALPYVGMQAIDGEAAAELRNCTRCCSTLARLVA